MDLCRNIKSLRQRVAKVWGFENERLWKEFSFVKKNNHEKMFHENYARILALKLGNNPI